MEETMKKLTALLVAGLMVSSLAVTANAYWEPEEAFQEVKFTIGKQTVAWNPDGTITDGEYYKVEIDPTWISYAINDNDTDAGLEYAKSITPELYMSWDESNIYCATRYEVPKGHENLWDGDPGSMWYSGAVQFNYANFDEVASEYRLEYGVGLSSDTGDTLYTVWADGAGTGFTPSEENAKVWLDGNTLTYETKVAWEDFADEDNTAGKEGLGFNFCLVWSVGKGQDYVHIQLAEGCTGNGKHAENFAQVTLGGPIEVAPAYTYPNSGTEGNLINGTVIGNETGWGDNADAGAAAAFDGNPATFFDPLGVGDGFCGMDAGESYILDKVAILSRDGWADRFAGAMIQGSNDGENWTTLWTSDAAAASTTEYTIVTEFENNTGYSQFRYFNETNHGDVAEVEFYGNPGKVEVVEEPAAEEPAAEEPAAESKGFATVEDAAAGKTVISGYTFVEGSNGFGGEGAENLWDGDTATKFCTNEFPVVSVAELDGVYNINGFTMATANDNADYNGRNPNDWTISVSADGENWTELAKGDDTFFEETNFTYYAGEAAAEGVSYVKFEAASTAANLFQVSELNLLGEKTADKAADAETVDQAMDDKAEAPQTFDFGIAAAVAAVVSLAGFAASKKHH
jgi:hypothetical protein